MDSTAIRQALGLAHDALDFRSEWLDDYGVREYGDEKAAEMLADVVAAWRLLFTKPDIVAIDAALGDLETLAGDPRRDVENLGGDLLSIHRRLVEAVGFTTGRDEEPRTILVHVNVSVPADSPATADDIAAEVRAALEVTTDDPCAADYVPGLVASTWSVPLAEEM